MPRQFQDFSQEVSQGTNKIKSGLDAVRNAADQADVSSDNLSKTQGSGIRVADGYSRTMAGVSRELSGVASAGKTAVRELSGADSVIKSFGSSLASLKGASSELYEIKDAAEGIRDVKMDYLNKQISMISKESGMAASSLGGVKTDLTSISKLKWGELKALRESFGFGEMSRGIKSLQNELTKLEGAVEPLSDLQRASFLEFSIRLAGARELESFLDELPDAEKSIVGATIASKGLDAAISDLADRNELFAAKLKIAADSAEDAATSSKTYAQEVEKAGGILGAFNDKLEEGKREAEGFAGGLGTSTGKAVGAGVAVFFLAKKAAELVDQFKDAAIELSRFNVELAALEARAQGLGFQGTFDSLRDDLNLTRAQSKEFFDVLRDGASSGVVSVNQLSKAALQLRDTFGGEQTERLREYVELLKSIPTLESDLSITASLDDRAAAVFSLAREGKIEAVIDLQAAGLLGGIQAEVMSEQDVELLNAAQKTEKTIEDVQDFLTGTLFPSWGPQFSAIAEGTGKVVAGIGGAVVALGVLNALMGSQIASQNATTAAVLASGGISATSDIGKSIGKAAAPGLLKGLKTAFMGGGGLATAGAGGGGAAVSGGAAGGVAAVAAPVAIAVAAAAVVAAVGYAGMKLSEFGDDLISEGNKVAGGLAKLEGGLMKASAAMTLLGPIVGPFAAIALAAEDIGGGMESLGKGLQEQVNGVDKYNGFIKGAGEVVQGAGMAIKEGGEAVVGTFKGIWRTAKDIGSFTAEVAKSTVRSKEYNEMLKDQRLNAATLSGEIRNLSKTSKAYNESLAEQQKKVQVSALALQRQLNATKSAVESGKVAFLDFANEVQGIRLDVLTDIGGTAGQFDNAIRQASNGFTMRFEALSKSLIKRRSDILNDAKLSARDRKNALMDLKRQELEATRAFVDGINKIVDALLQSPAIIKAGLERSIEQTKFDIETVGGTTDTGAVDRIIGRQTEALQKEQEAVFEGFRKAQEELKKGSEALKKINEQNVQSIIKDFEKFPDAVQKSLDAAGIRSGTIDIGKVGDVLEGVRKEAEKTDSQIDKVRKSLPDASFARLASELGKFSADAKAYGKALKKANEEVADARKSGDPTEIEEAEKTAASIAGKRAQAIEKQKEIEEKLFNTYGKQLKSTKDQKKIKDAIAQIASKIVSGEAVTAEELAKQKGMNSVMKEIVTNIGKAEGDNAQQALKNLGKLQKQADVQQKTIGSLEAIGDAANADINNRKKYNESLQKLKELTDAGKQISDNILASIELVTMSLRRQAETLQSQQSLALLTNTASENLLAIRQKQNEIATKSISEIDKRIASEKERLKKEQESAATAGDVATRKAAEAQVKIIETTIAELNKKRGDAVEAFGRVGDAISQGLEAFNDSLSGRAIQQQFDLSDVTADLAQFSDDFEGAVAKSTDIAIAAANRRAAAERKILAGQLAQEERDLKARAAAAGAKGPQVLAEGKALIAAKKRTEEARIELQQKQKVVEAAQREASLKLEAIGLEEELVDAEMEFLSEIGGSFSSILKLQQQGVQLERDKLAVLQEELETAKANGVSGIELRKKEVALEKQRFAVQRKEFGAQKDVFEKLLGKAFGEMRTEIGAARRRGTDVGMLGRDRTRVMGRSGLFMKTKPGDVKPIAERAAANRINATFGGMGSRAVGQGLAGTAPERLSIEEQIAKDNKTTAEQTKSTAENTAKLVELMQGVASPGGMGVTGGLGRVLTVQKREDEGMKKTMEQSVSQVMDNLPAGFRDLAVAGASLMGFADMITGTGEPNQEAVSETSDRISKDESVRTDRASLEDKAGVAPSLTLGTAGGAGGLAAMMPSEIRVLGQINIMMDTNLFRAEMATLVAEAVGTSEVRNALDKRYLTAEA